MPGERGERAFATLPPRAVEDRGRGRAGGALPGRGAPRGPGRVPRHGVPPRQGPVHHQHPSGGELPPVPPHHQRLPGLFARVHLLWMGRNAGPHGGRPDTPPGGRPDPGQDRRYRRYVETTVLDHWSVVRPAWRTVLDDGTTLITSGDHRFLSDRGWKYVTGAEHGAWRRPHLTTSNRLLGPGRFVDGPKDS